MAKKSEIPQVNRKIKTFTDIIFDDIPYSPETYKAQKDIEKALAEEYGSLCCEMSEGEALDRLLAEYGQLPQIDAETVSQTATAHLCREHFCRRGHNRGILADI